MREFIRIVEGADLTFRTEVRGHHHGQMDATLLAYRGKESVGYIDYSVYEGEPAIQMIKVEPVYQRQGVATAMLRQLQSEYPDTEIEWGGMTTDGSALYDKTTFDDVPDPVMRKRLSLLDGLKQRLATVEATFKRLADEGAPTERLNALSDRWRRLEDRVSALMWELRDAKPTRRLIARGERAWE